LFRALPFLQPGRTAFGQLNGQGFARDLSAGDIITKNDNFENGFILMDRCKAAPTNVYASGSWTEVKNRYLGLEFSIAGRIHFGWARLNVTLNRLHCQVSATLTGYAYETEIAKPIAAGKISGQDEAETRYPRPTLGALALGSAGLAAWKRE
jgi:hypothetical protein